MKITINICTHNRSELLLQTIKSINNAKKPKNIDLSILVIANACYDDTLIKLEQYINNQKKAKLLPLHYEIEPNAGKSYALNKALDLIKNGWICFIDDDHRLDSNYFNAIVDSIIKYPDTLLFCGKIIPDWTGKEPAWAHDQSKYRIFPFPVPYYDLGNEELLLSDNRILTGGGNMIINRKVFSYIGYFSEDLGPKGHNLMGGEDSDLITRAFNANQKLRYSPNIVQYHYVDLNNFKLYYLLKKSYQRNRSITLIDNPKSSKPPLYLWKKIIVYFFKSIIIVDINKSRFYACKLAAIFGQIFGFIQSHQE